MCCSAGDGDELEGTLQRLADVVVDGDFDYAVVETSGLADPTPVISALMQVSRQRGTLRLDAVITVVDAKNLPVHLGGGLFAHLKEASRQVGVADVVVVNKCDLVSAEEAEAVVERVREVGGRARERARRVGACVRACRARAAALTRVCCPSATSDQPRGCSASVLALRCASVPPPQRQPVRQRQRRSRAPPASRTPPPA